MARAVIIRVRATEQEYTSIKNSAYVRGFPTVSAFLRSFGLERDFWIEKKVQETHHIVQEIYHLLKK